MLLKCSSSLMQSHTSAPQEPVFGWIVRRNTCFSWKPHVHPNLVRFHLHRMATKYASIASLKLNPLDQIALFTLMEALALDTCDVISLF